MREDGGGVKVKSLGNEDPSNPKIFCFKAAFQLIFKSLQPDSLQCH